MIRALFIWCAASALAFGLSPEPFLEKPYLQLGDAARLSSKESFALLWHTTAPGAWTVEARNAGEKAWRAMNAPTAQTVEAPGAPASVNAAGVAQPATAAIAPHQVYRAKLTGLKPGREFEYRVLLDGKEVFGASGRARESAKQPVRFVLFGDCAQGTPGQRAVAYQTALAKPDFVFVAGDVVYTAGRIAEYRSKFFPIYNSDTAGKEQGAPLLRSVPFIAAPGNHDLLEQNFGRFPDALAYYLYWDQPLNGATPSANPKTTHRLLGSEAAQPAFRAAATPRYPVMANFSFDYGNAHWTVLDSNAYMDWNEPELREWLEKDLASARGATWRFVAFHHPGFNSSKSHFTDQWMRALAPVFEKAKVDVVFAGHVHNYQRSFPLTFAPKPQPDGRATGPKGEVDGAWTLDKEFGDGNTGKPRGVIYIVSGAGGAGLYDQAQMKQPETWQAFTNKFISNEHSFTQVDLRGKTLTMKEISAAGRELDSFRISK